MNIWQRIVLYLVSVLVTLVIIIAMPWMGRAIIDNDKLSRERDTCIQRRQDDHYVEIKVALTKIQSKLGIDD